jgi:hypothetical protein
MILNPWELADGLLEVRWFGCLRFQNATPVNIIITFSDTTTLYVHSGDDKSHLTPDSERSSRSSAPTRSVGHDINWFCTRISILIYNSWFRIKMASPIVYMSCLTEQIHTQRNTWTRFLKKFRCHSQIFNWFSRIFWWGKFIQSGEIVRNLPFIWWVR